MFLLWCEEYNWRLWIGAKSRARNGEAKLLAIYVGKKYCGIVPTTRVLPWMTTYHQLSIFLGKKCPVLSSKYLFDSLRYFGYFIAILNSIHSLVYSLAILMANHYHKSKQLVFSFDNANSLHPNLDRAQALDHLDRPPEYEV